MLLPTSPKRNHIAFSSVYFNTPFGIGQMYSGQNEGLVLATNTAHPIRLNANRFAAGALNSIEIKGTGTRDVEINAPLLVKGASTVHSGSVTVNGSLVVGTTNVLTAINNLGASQLSPASVYTKTEVDDMRVDRLFGEPVVYLPRFINIHHTFEIVKLTFFTKGKPEPIIVCFEC